MSGGSTIVQQCVSSGEDFQAHLLDAKKKIDDLMLQKANAERRAELIRKNRDVLILDGRDPEAEFRALSAEIRKIDSAIGLAKSELHRACMEERAALVARKSECWGQVADAVVVPYKITTATIAATLREVKTSLDALAQVRDETPDYAQTIDEELVRFDEVLMTVGGAGNLRFGPDGTLRVILRRTLEDAHRRSGLSELLGSMGDTKERQAAFIDKARCDALGISDAPSEPKRNL